MLDQHIMGWPVRGRYILVPPEINSVTETRNRQMRLRTSEARDENGYYILKVRTRHYHVQPNGDLIFQGESFVEEFYTEHPGEGWVFAGLGKDGKIVDPAVER